MSAEQTSVVCGVLVLAALMSGCRGQCREGSRPFFIGVDIGDQAMHITSPDYPEDYPHNANCAWQFAAGHYHYVIRLRIITLQLDSDYDNCRSDYVDLYDVYFTETHVIRNTPRLARLCSEKYGKEFYSSKPYLYVRFLSDALANGPGFNLSVVAVPKTQAPRTAAPVTPFDSSASSTPFTISEDSSDDVFARVVGGTIGAVTIFVVIVIIFAVIFYLCRRQLKPCLESNEAPVPVIVSSAPQPGMVLHRDGGDPQEPASLMGEYDAMLPSHQLLPATPRTDGAWADAARGAGRSGSPRPGGRLEIPEHNGRSGSPGRGSPGGSPRHGSHLYVPEQGGRSGGPGQGSQGGGGRRRGSPEVSPRRGGQGGDPRRNDRGRSPRQDSPERRPRRDDQGRSPGRGGPDRSPRRDDRGRNPRHGSPDRSHRRRNRRGSPRQDDHGRSPRRGSPDGSHARPVSGPPPPIRSLDSSGITDAPPSYDEAIRASPQPSAPPLPHENFA